MNATEDMNEVGGCKDDKLTHQYSHVIVLKISPSQEQ